MQNTDRKRTTDTVLANYGLIRTITELVVPLVPCTAAWRWRSPDLIADSAFKCEQFNQLHEKMWCSRSMLTVDHITTNL